jgi:hypothetical protein
MLTAETVHTVVAAQDIAAKRGWDFGFNHVTGSIISEVRNIIVGMFLESGADQLLMLDSDQAASRATIDRMISFDKMLVGCIYPRRKFFWSQVDVAKSRSVEQLCYQASAFIGWLEEDEQGQSQIVDGCGKATYVGTGLVLIQRAVFENLMKRYPELKGRGFDQSLYPYLSENWGFFNHVPQENSSLLGEDVSLCQRWRAIGGDIWADVASDISHVGRYTYQGNYLDYLRALRS